MWKLCLKNCMICWSKSWQNWRTGSLVVEIERSKCLSFLFTEHVNTLSFALRSSNFDKSVSVPVICWLFCCKKLERYSSFARADPRSLIPSLWTWICGSRSAGRRCLLISLSRVWLLRGTVWMLIEDRRSEATSKAYFAHWIPMLISISSGIARTWPLGSTALILVSRVSRTGAKMRQKGRTALGLLVVPL